jgi:MFS family permease
MAGIAWNLSGHQPKAAPAAVGQRRILEWRVLAISITLAIYSFGYGGITSFTAMYADANGVTPKGIYLTALALIILCTRPILGGLGDRIGYRKVFVPCLVLISCGLGILSLGGSKPIMLASALAFGLGFGTAYPTYVGYVMRGVRPERRGAAFGAILAAFDTGIGTGSTAMGWLVQRFGFRTAFGVAAAISLLAVPYFLFADRTFGYKGRLVS